MANFTGEQLVTFTLTEGTQINSGKIYSSNYSTGTPIVNPNSPIFGPVDTYLMRGFDTNVSVNTTVYWFANSIDSTASQYKGSAGPVNNIVYLTRT